MRVPGKLILSGEHAVVYGQAALAFAFERYTTAQAQLIPGDHFELDLPNINFKKVWGRSQLRAHYQALRRSVESKAMAACLAPSDLILFTIGHYLERHQLPPCAISLHSDIPLGRGMGSSSAAILAVLAVLDSLQERPWHNLVDDGRDIEHLQHGISSGLDLACVEAGGLICFQAGKVERLRVALFPAWLIDTGPSHCLTKDCVERARSALQNETWRQQFGVISHRLKDALFEQNLADFKLAIADNHQLLCQLGVVPAPVQHFIKEIEAAGGAAKISGAGSIAGPGAGFVLAFDIEEAQLKASPYPYQALSVASAGLQHV